VFDQPILVAVPRDGELTYGQINSPLIAGLIKPESRYNLKQKSSQRPSALERLFVAFQKETVIDFKSLCCGTMVA
jgi:hypothetical protein